MKKINSSLFKSVMSKFPTGVAIITINNNNNYFGKTVNSFASVSLNPPLVLFSLEKKASSLKDYTKSSFFGINILSRKQKKFDFSEHSTSRAYFNERDIYCIENDITLKVTTEEI